MYVINVHGLASKVFNDAGTEKMSRAFPEISRFVSRKPITATIVIRTNTAMLIYISLVRLLPFLKVSFMSSQITINIKYLLFFYST